MSRIEELIREKCPDGVEYLMLGNMCDIKTGKGITKADGSEEGEYPIISGGMEPMGYYHMFNRSAKTVTVSRVGANAGFVNFLDSDFYLNDKCFSVIPVGEYGLKIISKYLFYVLKAMEPKIVELQSQGGVPTINTQKVSNIEIPVPPIQVQQEIVRILDKFTELEAELQAELAARKKQYEYYRDRLFVFKNNIERKNILNVISMKARVGWQALTKKEYLTTGDYYLITGTDFREDGCIEFDSCVYVSEERYDMDDNIKVHVNDILMTKDGTLGKVAFMEQEPPKSATLNGGVYRLTVKTEDVLPKYVYHYFTSYEFKCFIEKVKTGGTIKHLTQKWFETLEVPVPPIKKQEEIVRILDTFSALCNSRVLGLPAEIAARHKQYEYYRDKLLTFKRKEV